jgi:glycosyltransferase involved in cell wall biosynthesis
VTARRLSVLHFSTADILGGSARSAYRIHSGLRARGHVSRMLVGIRASDDPDVDTVWRGELGRLANRLADEVTRRTGHQYLYLPSTRRVLAHPWVGAAQVIQIYNTHGGYFATGMLTALSARAPLVWRLSDMWPMTGHCAYAAGCERWRSGCGACPDLATYPPIARDRTAELWRWKHELYAACRVTVVAPSSWIERLARESPLLGRFPVRRIPNGIDLQRFRPRDRAAARAALGIDARAQVVLFTAHGLDANARKGSEDAIEALRGLGARAGTLVVLAGAGGEGWVGRLQLPVLRLGFVSEEEKLAQLYAAADVLLAPSRSENLPNNVLEALASGVPVVAYDAGGMGDAVKHLQTGWLAPDGDASALLEGLRRILDDAALRRRLAEGARRTAEQEFDRAREVRLFEELHAELAAP